MLLFSKRWNWLAEEKTISRNTRVVGIQSILKVFWNIFHCWFSVNKIWKSKIFALPFSSFIFIPLFKYSFFEKETWQNARNQKRIWKHGKCLSRRDLQLLHHLMYCWMYFRLDTYYSDHLQTILILYTYEWGSVRTI